MAGRETKTWGKPREGETQKRGRDKTKGLRGEKQNQGRFWSINQQTLCFYHHHLRLERRRLGRETGGGGKKSHEHEEEKLRAESRETVGNWSKNPATKKPEDAEEGDAEKKNECFHHDQNQCCCCLRCFQNQSRRDVGCDIVSDRTHISKKRNTNLISATILIVMAMVLASIVQGSRDHHLGWIPTTINTTTRSSICNKESIAKCMAEDKE
ncbi:hypothetical protein NC651_031411 [Populus alba x Populus x berolinensis]|nr:hypothetical protein NC651_031411 [Populus alba x Populus x berolinensis]